jgi:tetratricopeptide (TPR) repeat protein
MKALYNIYLSFVMTIAVATTAVAQTTEEAVTALQAGNVEGAVTIIDKCVKDPAQNTSWEAWYYKGFIYKELSKKQTGDIAQKSRVEAFTALKKAIQLDPKKENYDQDSLTIKYLSSKFSNEANALLNANTYDKAIEYFDYYKQCFKIIDPKNEDIKKRELLFKAALGSVFVEIYEKDSKRDDAFKQAVEIYSQILKTDSTDANANRQIGIVYYNKGLAITLDPTIVEDIMAMQAAEEKSVQEYKKALPYMQRAYKYGKTKGVVEGLRNIYSALNESDSTNKYALELDNFK